MNYGTDEQAEPPETTLREPLRRIDSILAFARKLLHTGDEIPVGLIDDFMEARTELERVFVAGFAKLDPRIQKEMRKFILQTRNLTQKRLKANLSVVSRKVRSILNALMIHGSPTLSLMDDGDADITTGRIESVNFDETKTVDRGQPRNRRLIVAITLIAGLGAAGLAAAYFGGLFPATSGDNYSARLNTPVANANTGTPANIAPPDNTRPVAKFDPAAAGYGRALRVESLRNPIDPLESGPDDLKPRDLPAVLLGLEGQIHLIEPERLKSTPEKTRNDLRKFALSVVEHEAEWIKNESRLIDAFTDHVGTQLQLALYREADEVLLSDVLASKGGARLQLVLTVTALGLAANCPFYVIAPSGIARVDLAAPVFDETWTWNGQDLGLRVGTVKPARLSELLAELMVKLRPTMKTPAGRALVSAMLLRQRGELNRMQARRAMAEFNIDWLTRPTDDESEHLWLLQLVANMLEAEFCRVLLPEAAAGTVEEAILLFHIASAAKDVANSERALLLMGKRAKPGAMFDGEPLALVIGDLLQDKKRFVEADDWYTRGMKRHKDDARLPMRLSVRAAPEKRFELMIEAYARGERSADFLRELARLQAVAGKDLSALALMDELTALKAATSADFHAAALLCLSMEHPDWAQERIARAGDAALEPELLRLDLICELQRFALSDRAKQLAEKYRATGRSDPYLQSLLRRHGG